MVPGPSSRWVVIGNSGSGKSTLAERVGTVRLVPTFDLDLIHWHPDGRKRDEADAKARVAEIAMGTAWVIEGVYGWLAEAALPRADTLIWLDLSWNDCRDGLLARRLRRGMTQRDQDALLTWAQHYWLRETSSSFAGHKRIYDAFEGAKCRLRTRSAIDALAF